MDKVPIQNWVCKKCDKFLKDKTYITVACFHLICTECYKEIPKNEYSKCPACGKADVIFKVELLSSIKKL